METYKLRIGQLSIVFRFLEGTRIFCLLETSRPALGTTEPQI